MAKSTLQQELRKKKPFELAEEEAFLNIVRTHGILSERILKLQKLSGTSPPQYNILRILRGHGGDGLPSLEIADQMLTRVPDITRLVDRLEKANLVERQRSTTDRRVVIVKITKNGINLLATMDEPIRQAHRDNLSHMTKTELKELSRLLVKARNSKD